MYPHKTNCYCKSIIIPLQKNNCFPETCLKICKPFINNGTDKGYEKSRRLQKAIGRY